MKKLIFGIVGVLLAVAMTLSFASCNMGEKNDDILNYVSIKINPAIELVTSGRNKVLAVYAANEDAEILLAETDLLEMSAEDAIASIIALAVEAGYLEKDHEAKEIFIGVIGNEKYENKALKLCNQLKERARKALKNKGINAKVSEQALNQYAQQAMEQGVSVGKMKMMLRAIELNSSLEIAELKKMEIKELISLYKEQAELGLGCGMHNEFNRERAELREHYADMFILEEEIKGLQEQLKNYAGDEDGRIALQEMIAQKQGEMNTFKTDYEDDLHGLIAEMQQAKEQVREQHKEQLHQRLENQKRARGN
jgi:hypothetical protein